MRTLIAVTSLAMALTPAMAQTKGDKLDADAPRVVRTVPITLSFDQRWFGPAQEDRWIRNQPPPSDRFTPTATQQPAEPENAPAVISGARSALPEAVGIVPVPGNRLRHDPPPVGAHRSQEPVPQPKAKPLVTAAAGDICTRHNLRKVWQGRTWRCR